ncbi:N-terminal EF-hand calcium-binding protein 3 isoform X1 [Melopsittacus undulatus]|uniref:N-terminal EF-hand calcium-binding protein 3 isoform X1 n=1 Tax=Melopsittacus undulatus TaxID=13146 RepID=UPI00146E5389|nr:N-terminal EF-hand calcium-binding protein 3 isoform X1 [Melopsittacus undulatus]
MMACAELLAVCLLSANRGPAPRRQPLPIFYDIFRRADKNDDGKLSFEEFKNYFADGILSSEELWELFSGIDRHHSDNVDTEKLCDYFSAYLGEYRNVLSALEALNSAVLAAMDKTKLRYETSSKMEQFLTRFLLRETLQQLQSLQASLECAVDTVEEQAGRDRKDTKKPETMVGLRSGRRCGRRGQKNVCLSPTDPYSGMLTTGVCVKDNSQWMAQINRLQQLIEKLECKSPRLEPLKEEAMCKGRDACLCLQAEGRGLLHPVRVLAGRNRLEEPPAVELQQDIPALHHQPAGVPGAADHHALPSILVDHEQQLSRGSRLQDSAAVWKTWSAQHSRHVRHLRVLIPSCSAQGLPARPLALPLPAPLIYSLPKPLAAVGAVLRVAAGEHWAGCCVPPPPPRAPLPLGSAARWGVLGGTAVASPALALALPMGPVPRVHCEQCLIER